MRSIYITPFPLKLINFNKFIELIPTEETNAEPVDDCVKITTLEGDSSFQPAWHDDSTYVILACKLRKASHENIVNILKQDLLTHLRQQIKWRKSFHDLLEDMAVDSAENFGEPEYAIRVAPRVWMLAKPDDFKILRSNDQITLAPLAIGRTPLYNVQRISEEEVNEANDIILSEFRKKFKRR